MKKCIIKNDNVSLNGYIVRKTYTAYLFIYQKTTAKRTLQYLITQVKIRYTLYNIFSILFQYLDKATNSRRLNSGYFLLKIKGNPGLIFIKIKYILKNKRIHTREILCVKMSLRIIGNSFYTLIDFGCSNSSL